MQVIHDKLTPAQRAVINKIAAEHDRVRVEAHQTKAVIRVGRKELKQLGYGSFSAVYALDRKWAIRIEYRDDNCYREWAEFCTKVRNKHLPKIAFHGIVDNYAVTVVGRLEGIGYSWEQPVWQLERILGGYDRRRPLQEELKGAVCRKSLKRLAKRVEAAGLCINDMHTGNVMLRKDGRVVFTDPVA